MNEQATVAEVLREVAAMLAAAGIEPGADAELLLGHVLRESRGGVQAAAFIGRGISDEDREAALELAGERARRVPLQHLTGRAPFRSIELEVGPGVFVPRPETEVVAQIAIDALSSALFAARAVGPSTPEPAPSFPEPVEGSERLGMSEPSPFSSTGLENGETTGSERGEALIAVDLCTGSGALALAIAQEVPAARVWAVEKSVEAHAWASRNVASLGEGRVTLILGDVRELDPARGSEPGPGPDPARERSAPAPGSGDARPDPGSRGGGLVEAFAEMRGRVHLLVSNPPYVPEGMVPRDPEVRDHDPELALYGGPDGLDLVRVISRVGLDIVMPGGTIVLEHAEGQGAAIRALLAADGWRSPVTRKDLTLRDRATAAVR